MVLSDLFTSLMQILFRPWILLPMIIILLVSGAISITNSWALEGPLNDFVLYYDTIPNDNLLGVMLANYPLEIASMLVFGFILSIIGIIGMISVSRMIKGDGFIDAINDSVGDWKKAGALTIVLWLYFIIFGFAFSTAFALSSINEIISLIFVTIFLVSALVVLVKVAFIFPALIGREPKKAIQETWKFTDKKFWGTVALIISASFISLVGLVIISQIGVIVGGIFDVLLSIIGEAFGTTYFIAALTNYFYAKRK
ncbi:MAG: hypothetical protein WC462_02670 [archaeon]